MTDILGAVSGLIWGKGLVGMLLLAGVVYTVRFKAPQLRLFPELLRSIKRKDRSADGEGVSQAKAVCMSLGAAMGTGNIIGVASAISLGGSGAVFWMEVSAFLGMAVAYAENVLSAKYGDDELKGPPAYMIKRLGARGLAFVFSAACVGASFGMGGAVQINAASSAAAEAFGVGKALAAAASFAAVFAIVSGGAKRIGSAAQALLPAASILYAAACAAAIFVSRENLPSALENIFREAFSFRDAAGGFSGYAISVGVRRGVFSNEAGLGSSPLLHSASENAFSETQGLWAAFEVFADTILCCSATAIAILCASPDGSVEGALRAVLGGKAPAFLAAETVVFAFCTVLGWYYCGRTTFLFISKGRFAPGFALVFSVVASAGALVSAEVVWLASDIFNGIMALANVSALLLLVKLPGKE